MVYYSNIPQATDRPSQSQAQIAANFSDLDTVFNDNHIGFSQANDRGEHRKVTFNSVIADPAEADPKCSLYIKTIGLDSQLFFENYNNTTAANVVRQVSNITPSTTATVYGTLYAIRDVSGLIHTWGRLTIPDGLAETVALTNPITYTNYSVNLTQEGGTSYSVGVTSLIGASFKIKRASTTGAVVVSVQAIGI